MESQNPSIFAELFKQAGSTAIDVYRDKSTSKLENRKIDTKGDTVQTAADSSGMSAGIMIAIAAVVGLVVLVLILRR